jgi:hypothetical protein
LCFNVPPVQQYDKNVRNRTLKHKKRRKREREEGRKEGHGFSGWLHP